MSNTSIWYCAKHVYFPLFVGGGGSAAAAYNQFSYYRVQMLWLLYTLFLYLEYINVNVNEMSLYVLWCCSCDVNYYFRMLLMCVCLCYNWIFSVHLLFPYCSSQFCSKFIITLRQSYTLQLQQWTTKQLYQVACYSKVQDCCNKQHGKVALTLWIEMISSVMYIYITVWFTCSKFENDLIYFTLL